MNKVKRICSNKDCSFKPVKFNTFEYMYCSSCKSEVDENLVEYKAVQKALSDYNNINPHLNKDASQDNDENMQGDLFDFWSGSF